MRRLVMLAALAALIGVEAAAAPTMTPTAPVATNSGSVRGVESVAMREYLGIPYAAPPVGDRRWTPPQPAEPWAGVRGAAVPGASCIQVIAAGMADPNDHYSEDCLYLNVTVPTGAQGPLPVMAWIHGGGFGNGAGYQYDAQRLATAGRVIVVTINYRLGAFGFLGLPGLVGSGDFGLLDQQAALRWVRANIAAFGGDARNVTVFGESAGAMSVCAQLVSPGAAGLFDKAILESGSCLQSWRKGMIFPHGPAYQQFAPQGEVQQLGTETAAKLGCNGPETLACLRRVAAEDLLKAWPYSRPAFGGTTLPTEPAKALAAGDFVRVPIIWGGTRDEWRAAAGPFAHQSPVTPDVYHQLLVETFGPQADQVEAVYPATDEGGPAYAWAAVSTDSAWSCPTEASADWARAHTAVYLYEFADRDAPNPAYAIGPDFKLGAAHATDLAYLFDLVGKHAAFTPAQEALSAEMMRYWANFARTGDPNGAGLAVWTPLADVHDTHGLQLVPGDVHMTDLAVEHHCAFWARLAA